MKGWKEPRRAQLKPIAASLCLQVGGASSETSKLCRVRVLFYLNSSGSFERNVEREIAADGIGYVYTIHCVRALPCPRAFKMIAATGISHNARCQQQRALIVLRAQRHVRQCLGANDIGGTGFAGT